MFKVVASEGGRADDEKLFAWARSHQRCALRYADGRGRWLHDLVDSLRQDDPGTTFVRISYQPDRIERVLLELAASVGNALAEAVSAQLRTEPDVPTSTLQLLAEGLGDRRLIVDGWSALESTEETYAVGHALDPRISEVRTWIAHRAWIVADRTMSVPPAFELYPQRTDGDQPPSALRNGAVVSRPDLWQRFAPCVEDYETALALVALSEGAWSQSMPPAWKLRDHVARRLPSSARDLLYAASVHARPLTAPVIAQLGIPASATELLVRLGLCHSTDAGITAEPAWTVWCATDVEVQAGNYHSRLAQSFASLVDPSDESITADRAALAVLEAHRHFLAAGNVEQARRFARYTAANLVEFGKHRSMSGDHLGAAKIYQDVLDLADRGQLALGDRLRAYAKHYVHFNRAHAKAENLRDTERGYRESVERWPDNALFWSRLIRTQVYRSARGDALATLASARLAVPDHPEKWTVLLARTVRGLLASRHGEQFIVDAVLLWGGYVPDSDFARDVEQQLALSLGRGWSTLRLDVPDVEPLWFFEPQRVRITRSSQFWVAELPDLNVAKRGETPCAALTNLTKTLRENAAMFLSALTHTLEPQMRLQKQILLGAIDVITSRLDAPGQRAVWLVGDLQRTPDHRLLLVTNDSRGLAFEVMPEIEAGLVVRDVPYLAQVATGPSGVPQGPVLSLEPAYGTSDDVLRVWFARASDAS